MWLVDGILSTLYGEALADLQTQQCAKVERRQLTRPVKHSGTSDPKTQTLVDGILCTFMRGTCGPADIVRSVPKKTLVFTADG